MAAYYNGNLGPMLNQDPSLSPFFGISVTGYLNPAPAGNFGSAVFSASQNANGLPINNIASPMQLYHLPLTPITPEPSTIALAGLCGLTLFLFRRRK